MKDETLENWLEQQIEDAKIQGHLRSYRKNSDVADARLSAFKEVREKIRELWGIAA